MTEVHARRHGICAGILQIRKQGARHSADPLSTDICIETLQSRIFLPAMSSGNKQRPLTAREYFPICNPDVIFPPPPQNISDTSVRIINL